MKTVEIKGGTANMREQHEIKVRDRRLVESSAVAASSALSKLPSDKAELEELELSQMNLSRPEANALFELQDATIVASLVSWTLPEPIPDLDTIGDMDPEVYDKLAEATRTIGASIATKVNFEPTDPRSPEFESSPTTPSDVSEGASRADQEPQSIQPQQTVGVSTPSASPSQG
jgi:hypothetical protein